MGPAATPTAAHPTLTQSFQNAWESPADNSMECLELVKGKVGSPTSSSRQDSKAGSRPQNLQAQGNCRASSSGLQAHCPNVLPDNGAGRPQGKKGVNKLLFRPISSGDKEKEEGPDGSEVFQPPN